MSNTNTNKTPASKTTEQALETPSDITSPQTTSDPDQPSRRPTIKEALGRTFSAKHAKATGSIVKSVGNVAMGMHPLWLMGEAISGQKVGSRARQGQKEFLAASEVFRDILSISKNDIIVIIDQQLHSKGKATTETADVIKTAGELAIVVVSSSIEKAKSQMERNSPALKKSILKNGRQVVVVADKSLKNPMVITGVSKFAKAKGIPYPEAILKLASLALSKILAALPEDVQEEVREVVEEIDAAELERTSTKEAEDEAKEVVEKVEEGEKEAKDKKGGCVIA